MSAAARVLPRAPWSAPSWWRPRPLSLLVLCLALALFGVGEGMLVQARLGSAPWTVLAQGIDRQSGWGVGASAFLLSAIVLLLWLPLRQKPGLGTVANMLIIAVVLEAYLRMAAPVGSLPARIALCLGGIALIGAASAFYLTCYLGAGPRDGLMVGLCQRTGWRVGVVRSAIEISVCTVGWLLGGVLGLGTVLFALGVGWAVQIGLALIARCFPEPAVPPAANPSC